MIFLDNIQEFDSLAVGSRIQSARMKKGIKSLEMATLLDMSKNQYSRIECGSSVCGTKLLHQIAQYLEVSADYLLYGKTEDEYMNRIYLLLNGKSEKEIKKMIQVMEIMAL